MPGRPQSSPGGVRMSERLCGAANPPTPGLQASPCAASPPLPACSGDCCSPPWLLYLFILHQQGCCRLILARFKRERGKKKKRRNALWLFSLPRSWQQAAAAAIAAAPGRQAGGQAGRRGVRHTGRCGPRGSLNGTGPQPWTDAVPNLMPPSGFSGKCPHLLSWSCSCPSL